MLLQSPVVLGTSVTSTILAGDLITGFFKLLFVVAAFIYFIFAFVVTRQIKIMRTTLITPVSPIVRILGYLHFLFAFVVFVSFLVIL